VTYERFNYFWNEFVTRKHQESQKEQQKNSLSTLLGSLPIVSSELFLGFPLKGTLGGGFLWLVVAIFFLLPRKGVSNSMA